jgi:hypothetical protein
MKFSSIRIEGSILSPDLLEKISLGDNVPYQKGADFGFTASAKVKDEIAIAWADAQGLWGIFKRQRERYLAGQGRKDSATTLTRTTWITPLLQLLGYELDWQKEGTVVQGKNYAISHRASNRDNFPVHIMGFEDSLDKKRADSGPRMSPHGLIQEYLNLTEHMYAIVTNGSQLRLLRDSSRLVKLSYLEFDLERMFDEEAFADFALFFRLLHISRMPHKEIEGAQSIIEGYHQDSLEDGARIRNQLAKAVKTSIELLGQGFLDHPKNHDLRQELQNQSISPAEYLHTQMQLIYRMLFVMVIEERNLIFDDKASAEHIEIYYRYYSLQALRRASERPSFLEERHSDLWAQLRQTFAIFADNHKGKALGLPALGGELFTGSSLRRLENAELNNAALLKALRSLNAFYDDRSRQTIRVNYAHLNVEEFGSVYESLLEFDACIEPAGHGLNFSLKKGDERSSSGSHYTPDELVTPLIKHSLDYLIEDKLKAPDSEKEKALLSLKVCDPACGSGHILLNAARRLAHEVARVRTGEDQPSPASFRGAVRDVIRHCIYGVDKNPLAVELCKVALWLEAHNPGEPLHFIDHHIKCGDAIVGLARASELERGIAEETYAKALPSDDKEVLKTLRERNKKERKRWAIEKEAKPTELFGKVQNELLQKMQQLAQMPEHTPDQTTAKQQAYQQLLNGPAYMNLRILCDLQIAPWFMPRDKEHEKLLATDGDYRRELETHSYLPKNVTAAAWALGEEKRFFHWFLEFPEVFANKEGGFDCILGNPPFLGGQRLSGSFGLDYVQLLSYAYAPAGSMDLVGYFFRRAYELLRIQGFFGLISTNSIAQGGTREGGLDVIEKQSGNIVHAIRSIRWPGVAAVEVALVNLYKGDWKGKRVLDNKEVSSITTYLDDSESLGNPYPLFQNAGQSFQGSIVLGSGFVLEPEEAQALIAKDPRNKDVLFPYLNGEDLNSRPDQSPSRWVINFFDWPEEKARTYPDCFRIVEEKVKPERTRWKLDDQGNSVVGVYALRAPMPEKWWIYAEKRPKLYKTIAGMERVLVHSRVTKTHAFSIMQPGCVASEACVVFALPKGSQFAVLQSNLHEHWAWQYSSTMKGDRRYSPSDAYEKFPWPRILCESENILNKNGDSYLSFKNSLCLLFEMGNTRLANQFHNHELHRYSRAELSEMESLSSAEFQKRFGKDTWNLFRHLRSLPQAPALNEAVAGILELRRLHAEMDNAVLAAYGWTDLHLQHNFYDVDYLPENDRVRYTIEPSVRKEILKRLLLLNHRYHKEEMEQGLVDEQGKAVKKKSGKAAKGKKADESQTSLLM